MARPGRAVFGVGRCDEESQLPEALEAAINNPLLAQTTLSTAQGLIVNLVTQDKVSLQAFTQLGELVRSQVKFRPLIVMGQSVDPALATRFEILVLATGMETPTEGQMASQGANANGCGAGVNALDPDKVINVPEFLGLTRPPRHNGGLTLTDMEIPTFERRQLGKKR
ncbi:hypothetical protein [Ferrimonas pelagia]